MVKFAGFEGAIGLQHLDAPFHDKPLTEIFPKQGSEGATTLRARVLFMNLAAKTIGLTLRPDLVKHFKVSKVKELGYGMAPFSSFHGSLFRWLF